MQRAATTERVILRFKKGARNGDFATCTLSPCSSSPDGHKHNLNHIFFLAGSTQGLITIAKTASSIYTKMKTRKRSKSRVM